jgi:hypothetical protein
MIEDEQTVENTDRNTRNVKTIALHFLAGFGTGVFLAFLLFLTIYFSPSRRSPFNKARSRSPCTTPRDSQCSARRSLPKNTLEITGFIVRTLNLMIQLIQQ